MELEEMKNLWQEHEQSLKKINTLNEKLLRRIIKEKSQSSLDRIKNIEHLSGCIGLLMTLVFLLMIRQVGNKPEMIVSYFLVLASFVATIIWYVYKVKFLSGIDILNGSIRDTAKKTEKFRLYIIRERLMTFPFAIILLPAAYILSFQWTHHESAFNHIAFSIPRLIIMIVLAIVITLIIYRRAYFNNLKTIINNLKEIEGFEQD